MKIFIVRTDSVSNRIATAIVVATILLMGGASSATAQTSVFTYQGRLTDGGTAANGTYDMQFKLFDGAGNQIGAGITNSAVAVNSGVFTVQLDYGAAAFSGADRFLEIGMRLAGSGEQYTVLAPRQQLTSAVYAIRAGSTTTADNANQLGGVSASQYIQAGDSRLSDPRPPTPGSASYIQNSSNQQAANFNISGDGTAGGTLSASIVNAATQYNVNGLRMISFIGLNNVSIGVDSAKMAPAFAQNNTFVGAHAGKENLTSNNSFFGSFAGYLNTTGVSNSIFGAFTGNQLTTGSYNSFFGSSAGTALKTGDQNSFFGASAGYFNDGNDNSFFGLGAGAGSLGANGSDNSFFGHSAGAVNSTGYANSFFGKEAGTANKDGFENAFFGRDAGKKNVSGSSNAFFGMDAGSSNSSGTFNTFVGRSAGAANVAGSNNTLLGASTDLDFGAMTYATAIGAGAHVATSNTIVLGRGNGSDGVRVPGTMTLGTLGSAGSTSICRNASNQISTCSSSLRYKTNIQPFSGGLAVLNRLRPITFDWKQNGMPDLGFGAEDVAAVEPLLITRNDKNEVEGVKYDRITVVLVNAVKEQQAQIVRQQLEIEVLKKLVCLRNRRVRQCR